jgi:hypothetical protein
MVSCELPHRPEPAGQRLATFERGHAVRCGFISRTVKTAGSVAHIGEKRH